MHNLLLGKESINKGERIMNPEKQEKTKEIKNGSKKKKMLITVVCLLCAALIFALICSNIIIPEIGYKRAMDAVAAENYIQAYEGLLSLNGYKDSSEKADDIFEDYFAQSLSDVSAGDMLYLGEYNGAPLSWTVVSIRKDYAILACNSIVATQPYNNEQGDINSALDSYYYNEWPVCSLRKWMNNDFLNAAFNDTEQALLKKASVPSAGVVKDEGTVSDYVYILSRDEMEAAVKAGWDSSYEVRENALWLRGSSGTNGYFAEGHNTGVEHDLNKLTSSYGIVPVIWLPAETKNVPEKSVFDVVEPQEKNPSGGSSRSKCRSCNGSGKQLVKWYSEGDWGEVSYTTYDCSACGGTGYN